MSNNFSKKVYNSDISVINSIAKEIEDKIQRDHISFERAKDLFRKRLEPMMNDLVAEGENEIYGKLDSIINDSINSLRRFYKNMNESLYTNDVDETVDKALDNFEKIYTDYYVRMEVDDSNKENWVTTFYILTNDDKKVVGKFKADDQKILDNGSKWLLNELVSIMEYRKREFKESYSHSKPISNLLRIADNHSNNKYNLFNLYESKKWTISQNNQLKEMIEKNQSLKEIHDYMVEDKIVPNSDLDQALKIAQEIDPSAKVDYSSDIIYAGDDGHPHWAIQLDGDGRAWDDWGSDKKTLEKIKKAINDASDQYWQGFRNSLVESYLKEESVFNGLDVDIKEAGGKDNWLAKAHKHLSDYKKEIVYLRDKAPQEVGAGGQFDSQAEVDEASRKTEEQYEELLLRVNEVEENY